MGQFQNTYLDLPDASKHHLDVSLNLNSKLKKNYSRTCEIFNAHLQIDRKNGHETP